uniref:Uncharacterized protein n=1 Tax=Cucumis melo TaxID=3656 RepID=A0A9I9EMW0_CUCME
MYLITSRFRLLIASINIHKQINSKGCNVEGMISRAWKPLFLSPKEIKEIYGTRYIGGDQASGLVGLMDFFCFSELSSKDFIHVSYVENSFINYEEFSIVLQEYGHCFKNYLVKLTMRLHEVLTLEKT